MNEAQQSERPRSLLSVKDFAAKHGFSDPQVRNWLFTKPEGFEKVVRRIGRKILIDEHQFFAWLDRVNGQGDD